MQVLILPVTEINPFPSMGLSLPGAYQRLAGMVSEGIFCSGSFLNYRSQESGSWVCLTLCLALGPQWQ